MGRRLAGVSLPLFSTIHKRGLTQVGYSNRSFLGQCNDCTGLFLIYWRAVLYMRFNRGAFYSPRTTTAHLKGQSFEPFGFHKWMQSFLDYMYGERCASPHTVRAYKTDLLGFLSYRDTLT